MINYNKVFSLEYNKNEESKEDFLTVALVIIGLSTITGISEFINIKRKENKEKEEKFKPYKLSEEILIKFIKPYLSEVVKTLAKISKEVSLKYKTYLSENNFKICVVSEKDIIDNIRLINENNSKYEFDIPIEIYLFNQNNNYKAINGDIDIKLMDEILSDNRLKKCKIFKGFNTKNFIIDKNDLSDLDDYSYDGPIVQGYYIHGYLLSDNGDKNDRL